MAWSSYAHLPNGQNEYWEILSKIEDDMPTKKVDEIIAIQKKKEKVQHHYRSNLARIGFFDIYNNKILLKYDLAKLRSDKNYLRTIFRKVLRENKGKEVQIVKELIVDLQSYDLKYIVDELARQYSLVTYQNFVRWIRPLVSLMKFADILSIKRHDKRFFYVRSLQEAYFRITNSFIEAIPLELVEFQLKKIDASLSLVEVIDHTLSDYRTKFKIELLMMPNWATKSRYYKMNEDIYTHIKIKEDLLEED